MNSSGVSGLSGKVLGQFEIMEEIGRGGMATVYRARQRNINRVVAIKVLPQALMHDPAFYERFAREVDVIAQLEHPHILPIYDYGEVDGVPFIAMRYLAGGSLAQSIRRGLMSFDALIRPIDQIGQALDHAHLQGIIHRDLKPANILLDERGNAYLTDFGIARVLNSNLTGSAIIGTPAYMSPEQANGLPLDSRSDIYAFGIVLFELLTGREPYEAPTPVAMLMKHINEPMPPLRQFRPEAGSAIEAVIQRATAKQPADRFASAGDVAAAYAGAVYAGDADTPTQTAGVSAPSSVSGSRPRLTPVPATRPVQDAATIAPTSAATPPRTQTVPPATPAEQHTLLEAAPPRRSLAPLLIGLVVVLVGAVAVLLLLITSNRPAPVTITPTPNALALAPTPFSGGTVVEADGYRVTMPEGWVFADQSNADGLNHEWQIAEDAALWLLQPAAVDGAGFSAQIRAFTDAHYFPEEFTLIDEATAPDGTVRHSYRWTGSYGTGQLDVFFYAEPFTVFEFFAADRWGNDLTAQFQQVLDSLRLS